MKTECLQGLDSIAETLLIPLCYRAIEARRPDPLVCDPRAQDIIDQLGVDPAHLKGRASQQLFAMLRTRQFDRWAKAFINTHPQATVVEIGCGLDARYERLADDRVNWFDLDLPEVITLRRRYFTDTSRRQMLAYSMFQPEWLDDVPSEGAHLFLAEGVFPYFSENEVRREFIALAGRFPGSELIVDALAPFMIHSSAVVPTFRGYQARPQWSLSDPQDIESWGSGIKLLESYGYFDQPEPRLANLRWMALIPIFRESARVLRVGLGVA